MHFEGKPQNEPSEANVPMTNKPREYRRVIVEVSPRDIMALFHPGVRAIAVEGIPADTEPIAAHYDFLKNMFQVAVEHPSFDPVPEGCMYPTLPARLLFEIQEPICCPECGREYTADPPWDFLQPFTYKCRCGEHFGIEPTAGGTWKYVPVLDMRTPRPEES